MKIKTFALTMCLGSSLLCMAGAPKMPASDESPIEVVKRVANLKESSSLSVVSEDTFYDSCTNTMYRVSKDNNNFVWFWRGANHISLKTKAEPTDRDDYVEVNIKFVYDEEEWVPESHVYAYNRKDSFSYQLYQTKEGTFQIPGGTYDFMTQFFSKKDGRTKALVAENVNVSTQSELNFDPSVESKIVNLWPLKPNGDKFKMPVYRSEYDPEIGDDVNVCVEEGNVNGFCYVLCGMKNLNYNFEYGYLSQLEGVREGQSPYMGAGMESNPVSDDYTFYYQLLCVHDDEEGTHYYGTTVIPDHMEGEYYSDVDNYKDVRMDYDWVKSADGQQSAVSEVPYFSFSYSHFSNGVPGMAIDRIAPEPNLVEIKYSRSKNESESGFMSAWFPILFDMEDQALMPWGEMGSVSRKINLCPIIDRNDRLYCLSAYQDEYLALNTDTRSISVIPGHERFAHYMDETDIVWGNTVPILKYSLNRQEMFPMENPPVSRALYIGRRNEMRQTDEYAMAYAYSNNGEPVSAGKGIDSFRNDFGMWLMDGGEPGKISITFSNHNVMVDEEEAFNEAEINVDFNNEDIYPPTLTRLMTRRAADDFVTDRFEKPNDGFIEFSAGDFNQIFRIRQVMWDMAQYYLEFEYAEPTKVEVNYRPSGTEVWFALSVNKDEGSYVDGYGELWRGSLGQIDKSSENGWYDLQFIIEDEAGNSQMQIASRAFKINDVSGIETVSAEENNGSLIYYDIQGNRVAYPSKGIYIEKDTNGSYRKVII